MQIKSWKNSGRNNWGPEVFEKSPQMSLKKSGKMLLLMMLLLLMMMRMLLLIAK